MSRSPQWATTVETAMNGDRTRAPLQTSPRWKWTLKSGILPTATGDLVAIQNLYNQMLGRLDYFLWQDPEGQDIEDPTLQIQVNGQSYWPVAFTHDSTDFDRFAYQLWECGTVEFEQVMLPTGGQVGPQPPSGSIVSATVSIKTENIAGGDSFDGITYVAVDGVPPPGNLFNTGPYAARTDTFIISATTAGITGMQMYFSNYNTLVHTVSGDPTEVRVYDVSITVVYTDGTTVTYRPTDAAINSADDSKGSIENVSNAVDGDASTYASIFRTGYNGLDPDHINSLVLSGFVAS